MTALISNLQRRFEQLTDTQVMLALFALALIVRVIAAAFFADFRPNVEIWEYGIQGRCAAETHGDLCMRDPTGAAYASALMPPLTSYLWRTLYLSFPGQVAQIVYVVLNVLFGALAAPLLYSFARAARTERPAALLAGLCICLYPTFVFISSSYHATNFTVALMLAGAIPLVLALQTGSWRLAPIAGVFVGLSAMTRNELLLAAAGMTPLFLWFGRKAFRNALIATAAFACGAGAVIAPWIVRNEIEFHRFIPGGSQAGYNLWIGFGPYARGSGNQFDSDLNARAAADTIRSSIVPGDQLGDRYEDRLQSAFAVDAMKTIKADGLGRVAWLTAQKATLLVLFDWTDPLTHSPAYWLPWLITNALAWFAIIQLLWGRARGLDARAATVMVVFIAAMGLAYSLSGVFSRYRMNIEVFEFVFAAIGAWILLKRFGAKSLAAPAPV